MKVCRRVGAALTAPPETPPSRRHAGRAARRQPAQCRASSAPARSAASSDLSATSDTSNARSGANCSSGPEVNEKKLCKRAFCPRRKSAKLMLVISPEELPNATTAPFASTACNAVANDAPPADLPQFDRPPPISCCRARKCSGSRYHSKEAYLWPSSPGCVHKLSTDLTIASSQRYCLADPLPVSFQLSGAPSDLAGSPPATPPPSSVDLHPVLRRWDGIGTARAAFQPNQTLDLDLGNWTGCRGIWRSLQP